MSAEFDKWWQGHAKHWMKSTALEVEDVGKAAYLAGYETARKDAADIVLEYNTTAAFSSVVDDILTDIQRMQPLEDV